jgi:hypothetical protein
VVDPKTLYADHQFLSPSPARGPFLDLLVHSPNDGAWKAGLTYRATARAAEAAEWASYAASFLAAERKPEKSKTNIDFISIATKACSPRSDRASLPYRARRSSRLGKVLRLRGSPALASCAGTNAPLAQDGFI